MQRMVVSLISSAKCEAEGNENWFSEEVTKRKLIIIFRCARKLEKSFFVCCKLPGNYKFTLQKAQLRGKPAQLSGKPNGQ